MVKVRVELLLMHDANSELSVTRQDIGMTLIWYPVLLLQIWKILKVNLHFLLRKNLFNVDCRAYRGRNVRKIRDVRVHFCPV
jgi:hypothetical protein